MDRNTEILQTTLFSKEPNTPTILPIPRSEDTLPTLRSKLTAIAQVISSGHSIAVATGYAASTHQSPNALRKAVNEMHPLERFAWNAFEEGTIILPAMNWTTNLDPTPTPLSPKPLRVARRRAEALNRIYKTNEALPAHVTWFTQNHLGCLPLVKAMARVIGAERDLIGGGTWTATQLADLQSINSILSVTAQVVKNGNGKGWGSKSETTRAIAQAQTVLASRRDELRSLIVGRSRKRKRDDFV